MINTDNLPYIKLKNTKITNYLGRFILKKIKKELLKKAPYHYLIFHRKDKYLKIIQKLSKKYPYFLRFDIEKFYPSINHKVLISILSQILKSRNGKKYLKEYIIPFLNQPQLFKRGLPLGNFLAYILAGCYLLPLDFQLIKNKKLFLRVQDDYLIFLKNRKEPFRIQKEIIEPMLIKLQLELNPKKITSGKFHEDNLNFIGFTYLGGVFQIEKEKIEEFKKKIIKITHLTKNKQLKAVIKNINNKILGFGHYYKFAKCKETFKTLDAYIRQRLRRYIFKNKNQKQKLANLILNNENLKNFGLKSLTEIKEKYDKKLKPKLKYTSKNNLIYKKLTKNLDNLVKEKAVSLLSKNSKLIENIYLKEIINRLETLTKKVNKIEKLFKEKDKN